MDQCFKGCHAQLPTDQDISCYCNCIFCEETRCGCFLNLKIEDLWMHVKITWMSWWKLRCFIKLNCYIPVNVYKVIIAAFYYSIIYYNIYENKIQAFPSNSFQQKLYSDLSTPSFTYW